MKLGILQARSTSQRMPGKVLAPLIGQPMILRQIERIRRSSLLDELVVATSVDPTDDALAELLVANAVTVRRGPLDDVFSRFLAVVEEFEPNTVVRLTGDNPLADPGVIDHVVSEHLAGGADYSSNSLVRSYPYGLDVECVRAPAFRALAGYDLTDREREHVTIGLYTRPDTFSLHPVTQDRDVSRLRWTVDYPEDFRFVTAVYERLYPGNPQFAMDDVLALLDEHPELARTVDEVQQ